ncbi:MAG: protein kinase [Gloeomargarita sp. SKYBB_i_bin120]|nr:protein kinase [Gloeomargarita sp. SKYG98]MCS7292210.1 protein kinase [Gloeomargarita sp. SKYB120]MDW8177771.1 protein kinase [Gloeomargarita sp. SKYBB_i_bin120]
MTSIDAFCTRPVCPQPQHTLHAVSREALLELPCPTCGMPLVLLGRYVPQRLLAQGGFGRTYLARDLYTPAQRLCVVKQLRTARFSPEELVTAQRLFHREAEVLEALGTHPQIPYLFASFDLTVQSANGQYDEEYFYLVQEYIPGEDLHRVLQRQGRLSEPEVTDILRSLLGILTFIHSQGVVHRDIKPANIMRHENGTLYLLDFGAVKQVVQGPLHDSQADLTTIGSLIYAPPEQMYGFQATPASDIYALGVTCVVLLTGCSPPQLIDPAQLRWQWRGFTTVGDGLARILDRMLCPNLQERYPDATTVLRDMEAFAATSTLTLPEFDEAALLEQLQGEGGLELRDRRYFLRIYPRCFAGSELMTQRGLARQQAIQVGQTLVARNLIRAVTDDQSFQDGYVLYRFCTDESADDAPQPVERLMSYRGQAYRPAERVVQSVELTGQFRYRGRTYETGALDTPGKDVSQTYTYRGRVYHRETP